MRDFPAKDVAPLKKRLAERTQALAAYRKQRAAAAKEAEAGAAKPANASKAAIAEIKEAADARYRLLILGDPDALVAGIRTSKLPPVVAWSYAEGLRVLPADLVPAVLAAKRDKRRDALRGRASSSSSASLIPPGTKLDPLLADAASVATIFRGDKAKVPAPARTRSATGSTRRHAGRACRARLSARTPPRSRARPRHARGRQLRARPARRRSVPLLSERRSWPAALEGVPPTLHDRDLRYAAGRAAARRKARRVR